MRLMIYQLIISLYELFVTTRIYDIPLTLTHIFLKYFSMPILYSVISRQTTILAKYAECVGNFAEVTEQVIAKIQLENHKLTYSHGNYLIHYICEDRIIYMAITDDVRFF